MWRPAPVERVSVLEAGGVKLYHFTTEQLWRRIRRQGLTLGVVPVSRDRRGVSLLTGYQWLTENPEFSPDWATRNLIGYRRDDVRITVDIPGAASGRLRRWDDIAPRICGNMLAELNHGFAHDEWWLYEGKVHPAWFSGVAFRREAA